MSSAVATVPSRIKSLDDLRRAQRDDLVRLAPQEPIGDKSPDEVQAIWREVIAGVRGGNPTDSYSVCNVSNPQVMRSLMRSAQSARNTQGNQPKKKQGG